MKNDPSKQSAFSIIFATFFAPRAMRISTTEITSTNIASDNPLHQRLLYPYEKALDYIHGDLIEIGCGEGRGLELLLKKASTYTAIDRNQQVLSNIRHRYPDLNLFCASVPPFTGIESDRFDSLVTFQVIEHVEDDKFFVDEVYRVLKPGGIAIITTPNRKMSLTRNPWHVREYEINDLLQLVKTKFTDVDMLGVFGNDRMNLYHERNRESVKKFTRFDVFNLQYRLPRSVLQVPYDILNRMNRNKLKEADDGLVTQITTADFSLKPADDGCFDLFCILKKT